MNHLLKPVLSADGMRRADAAAISDWGIPGRVLMENAGRAAVEAIAERFQIHGASIAVLCGRGNNGGDGFVVARILHDRGARVHAIACESATERAPDASANLVLLQRLAESSDRLTVSSSTDGLPASPDLVVDALLGIGVSGDLRDPERALCDWIHAQSCPVVALDIPSGLDATRGLAPEGTVRADLTVTFGALKSGLLLGKGPMLSGEVVVPDIGIPASELEHAAVAHLATPRWAGSRLPQRAYDAHKYSVGRAVCVVGSRAFTGAAVLSTAAAMRAGSGAVVACTAESAGPVLDATNAEVMVHALPETDLGGLSVTAYDAIVEQLARADAALIGCGLGGAVETKRLVLALLRRCEVPTVRDADGLTAFAGSMDKLAEHDGPLVLTPHLGELRRLLGDEKFDPPDRIECVRELAARWKAIVVLKGMPSVVGSPDGRVFLGPPPNSSLATAGAGDVLAGAIVGLLAQGVDPFEAANLALHLGSSAADLAAAAAGSGYGLIASDLVHNLPAAAAELRQAQ